MLLNDMNNNAQKPDNENDKFEIIRENYLIERELADRLRNSTTEERKTLYTTLYDEYHQRAPHHPSKSRTKNKKQLPRRMQQLKPFLNKDMVFLEVGPGDGQVCLAVAKNVHKVVAIDVSTEITKRISTPDNFQLIISDGSNIPVENNSIDLAYSNQLMEHLHPDDARQQLSNIFSALKPGGKYMCITPSALNGPHDISKYFDDIATGFHLKEYTNHELVKLFKQIGFKKIRCLWTPKGAVFQIFPAVIIVIERTLELFPIKLKRKIAHSRILSSFLDIRLLGEK